VISRLDRVPYKDGRPRAVEAGERRVPMSPYSSIMPTSYASGRPE
jgi:hypothetical protein